MHWWVNSINDMTNKRVYIYGGGTSTHITNHFAVAAAAYGTTARHLTVLCSDRFNYPKRTVKIVTHLTKMAGGRPGIETAVDLLASVNSIRSDPNTMVVFFNCAVADWTPTEVKLTGTDGHDHTMTQFGKHVTRLDTRDTTELTVKFIPTPKIISLIREKRKDIFVVGFKTTCNATPQEMFTKGLRLLKESHVNLCLVNDVVTRLNMIVTPEETTYHETTDRWFALKQLVDMAFFRSHLKFTQSTVVEGTLVSWEDTRVPASLRTIIDHCVAAGAYKPFRGATVGHFAVKLSDTEFLTSIRRSNFNDIATTGLVYVRTDGPDTVVAYGAKPSVGGQSQRIVFRDHPGYDCIVHFHCPFKSEHDDIPVRSQREVECGSHECGKNTSTGLKQFGNLKAVMLDNHGPNIVFNRDIDPAEVTAFIDRNFDLTGKTGGYQVE